MTIKAPQAYHCSKLKIVDYLQKPPNMGWVAQLIKTLVRYTKSPGFKPWLRRIFLAYLDDQATEYADVTT